MSTQLTTVPLFPERGWQTIGFWANYFDEEPETFKRKLKNKNVPFSHWGNTLMVKAEHLSSYFDSQVNREIDDDT